MTRLVKRLRQAWPHTLLIVRGDSHFAYPEVMQWIEEQPDLSYVTGLTSNRVLTELAGRSSSRPNVPMRAMAARSLASTRHVIRPDVVAPRRVVIKVEVSDQGVNTRFVVTDIEQARTKVLYQQIYCARGQAENEIKDHKRYLNRIARRVIALRPISSVRFCIRPPMCYWTPCVVRC